MTRAKLLQADTFHDGRVMLFHGDCLSVLATMPENTFDSCVTDPPYHFASIIKRFAKTGGGDRSASRVGVYTRHARGFMGKEWDGGQIAHDPKTWEAILRVLKPGAHLVAFGAPKNYHRLACAIEDAGFELRDSLLWLFGSGFPKSHDVGNGWGTALKPAYEPIVLARKPLSESTIAANVLKWGTGAINIDGCRIDTAPGDKGEWPITNRARGWSNKGKIGHVSTENNKGRWPANVTHDGSDVVVSVFPDSKSCDTPSNARPEGRILGGHRSQGAIYPGEDGSAARFFYTAKADEAERYGSKHPTVKPLDLMQWLARLVTPPNGTIIDPFAGTGTTAEAAIHEKFYCTLIEREAEYIEDVRTRMKYTRGFSQQERQKIFTRKAKDTGLLTFLNEGNK